jgi:hypothetical protein
MLPKAKPMTGVKS